MAVAVVLDISGSVLEKDLNRYRNSALDLAYRLKPDDTLALATFDEKGVQKVRDFSSTVAGLKPLLKQLKGEGNAPLYGASCWRAKSCACAPNAAARSPISDGADSASQATLREVEKQTFLAGVAVYAIDLVNTESSARRSPERQAAAQPLKPITQESGGRYISTEGGFFLMPSRMKLKRIFNDLIGELHSQYTIAYEPSNARREGRWRTIRVNLEQADLRREPDSATAEAVNEHEWPQSRGDTEKEGQGRRRDRSFLFSPSLRLRPCFSPSLWLCGSVADGNSNNDFERTTRISDQGNRRCNPD